MARSEKFIMAQQAHLEEVSQFLHDAYACLLANGLVGAGEALRILPNNASRIECAWPLQASVLSLQSHFVRAGKIRTAEHRRLRDARSIQCHQSLKLLQKYQGAA